MIKPMNKYAFLIFHREYEDFLHYLQGLGVVHITERQKPSEEASLKAINDERLEVKDLLRQLKPHLAENAVLPSAKSEGAISDTRSALQALEQCEDRVNTLREQVKRAEIWGEFDPERLALLASSGYRVQAYVISPMAYTPAYEEEYQCIPIAREGLHQYFIRLEEGNTAPCPEAERVALPEERLSVLRDKLVEAESAREACKADLANAAPQLTASLIAWDAHLENKFSYGAARLQGEAKADDTLLFLEGWIPTDTAEVMERELSQTGYYYQQIEIAEADRVPITLKNNVFARGFELLTKLYALPNYNEFDPTVLFAPFFMLFFGLCLGDAGYGLLILLVSAYLYFKNRGKGDTLAYELMMWLGGGGFIIGLLLGSFFGVVLPYASGKDYFLNQDNQMILSVIIGFIQIFFAKGVAAYKVKKQKGMKYALAPFAWIIFMITLIAVFALPALGITLSSTLTYALYAVVGLTALPILLYNSPGDNPLMNVGSALWAAYNNASGLLGDTLSYIRLFAIGLTGAVLGSVFNTLAIEQTEGLNPFVRFPLAFIVLLIGHSINIGLAMIGALVHPIRLTFVEYFKNSEYEGGGIAYNPLKNITTEQNENK